MRKERRLGARQPIDRAVYIRYRKRRFPGAQARNIAVAGMFLEVQALTLPVGTSVELEFRHLGRDWLIPASVTRSNENGLGIIFSEAQPELFRELTLGRTAMPPLAISDGAADSMLNR